MTEYFVDRTRQQIAKMFVEFFGQINLFSFLTLALEDVAFVEKLGKTRLSVENFVCMASNFVNLIM